MHDITELYIPSTVQEAAEILQNNEAAEIIAGGTDMLIKMRHKIKKGLALVDLSNLKDLKEIAILDNGDIEIGAMVTFTELAESRIITDHLPMLKKAALSVGGPQIQNVATIGGNICNGATSADSAPSLFALKAKLVLVGPNESRIVDIEDFYQGPSKVDLKRGEIVTKILIPVIADEMKWCGDYIKFSVRKAMDISMLGCAVVCAINRDGIIKDLRIALGTAAPTPIRCFEAEKIGLHKKLSLKLLGDIGEMALSDAKPRGSWRASKEYRLHLIKELTMKTLSEVFINAGGVFEG